MAAKRSPETARIRRSTELPEKEKKAKEASPELGELLALKHELQVHQIELEMQNDELRAAHAKVEAALERFTDLFDFAPVGYFTLTPDGVIKAVNLTGASLVGKERGRLLETRFGSLVSLSDRQAFKDLLGWVFSSGAPQPCELELAVEGRRSMIVHVAATASPSRLECRIVLTDITECKRAEKEQLQLKLMTASNQNLAKEIAHREQLQQELERSKQQLRQLSHAILNAQEEERKRISRDLHDIVVQTLVATNLHLAALSANSQNIPRPLKRKIAQMQRMVKKSASIVHQFAMELRPTVLDHLGLIPSLHALIKDYMNRAGVRVYLTACTEVEQLPADKRAVIYRLVAEALNNVAKHAKASHANVTIKKQPASLCIMIHDNGKSFDVKSVLSSKENGPLGLIGMRERVEMVGGTFSINSSPKRGTTISAEIFT